MDLALNNLQRLIRHKTQQTKPNQSNIGVCHLRYIPKKMGGVPNKAAD